MDRARRKTAAPATLIAVREKNENILHQFHLPSRLRPFLIIGANIAIHEFLDPTYHVTSARGMPRELIWYYFAYGWLKYFTTVYRVEVDENGFFRLKNIMKTQIIKFSDVAAINESKLLVNIFHENRKASISKLIDGVGNISTVIETYVIRTRELKYYPSHQRKES